MNLTGANPITGRELARRRLAMGISSFAVSRELGVHTGTLAAWERDVENLDPERQEKWDAALRHLALQRAHTLARQGWATADLPAGLRSTLRLYVK